MSFLGWVFMISSLAFVWGLMIWCFKKVLSAPEAVPEQAKEFHNA